MRPDTEIRAAIATLERLATVQNLPALYRTALAGEINGMRDALNEETGDDHDGPSLADTLATARRMFAQCDAEAVTPTGVTS